jgi:hypothetical protein
LTGELAHHNEHERRIRQREDWQVRRFCREETLTSTQNSLVADRLLICGVPNRFDKERLIPQLGQLEISL